MAYGGWWVVPQDLTTWGFVGGPTKARRNKSTVRPWQTCSLEQIKEYRKFPVLYGERKYARPFPKQKQTLSFTDDLPAEIRLLVYDHLFDAPNCFELWCPWYRRDTPWYLIGKYSAEDNAFRIYASKKRVLRILRLSKKVHEEAAAHFYGRVNFRFSQYNGFPAMAVFNHTLGRANCDLIRHITVQIPNRQHPPYFTVGRDSQLFGECMWSDPQWHTFDAAQRGRGLRVPDFGFRTTHACQGRKRGEFNYHRAVEMAYRQLRDMASLRTLEILIPWDYRFISRTYIPANPCRYVTGCGRDAGEDPRAIVRHYVEAHSSNPEYWAMLEDLKQHAASEDLTISLVLVYSDGAWSDAFLPPGRMEFLLQCRWLEAYAKVMGYRFGHTAPGTWEAYRSTYVVRYDRDEIISGPRGKSEHNSMMIEPPELD